MTHSYPTLITGGARRAFPGSNGLRTVAIATLYTGLILSIVAIGVVTGLNAKEPMLWATLVASLILLPLLWARPIFGVYILVGGVAVFETFPLNFPDSVTDQVVFFQTINSAGGPGFLLVNGAEVLMSLSLVTVVLRRLADRKKPLEFGPLFGPIALYTVMVAFGFVNGMRRGGDFDIALWEMRGQIYLILVYLLVVNTVDTKQQVTRLFWVLWPASQLRVSWEHGDSWSRWEATWTTSRS